MSTALLEPRAEARAADGGRPARRAVVRWAWRLFRREWRQQLLVLAMLVVAVAATVLGAAVGVNTPPPRNAGFGVADHLATLPGRDPNLAADIAAARERFGAVDVIEDRTIATGAVEGALLRAQDPHGRYGYPMLALVSGRYPAAPDEVAVTARLASTVDVGVGGVWRQDGRARRVVGIVENPQNLLDTFALVPPGQLDAPDRVRVLFDAAPRDGESSAFPGGATVQTPQAPQGFDPAIVVLIFAIFGLLFVGLVAVAGFSVLAQRRQRALGVLASLGATDSNIRLVMVANGAVVGVVATLAGTVAGLAAWIAYAPHLQTSTHHRVVWTALPWWLIATTMVLAVLTSVLAARRPARATARVSVVAALSGRPAPPKPAHRSALPGIVLFVTGPVLLFYSGGWGSHTGKDTLFELGGVLATAVAVLLLAPAGITVLGLIARRAPVAARLALRDLARYRARSGPALAAISLATLIAVLITLMATARYADPVDYFGPNLPANELALYQPDNGPAGGKPGGPATDGPGAAAPSQAHLRSVADSIATSLGSHDVLALQTSEARLLEAIPDGLVGYGGAIYVATPEVLRHYGIDPGTVDPNALLLTSRTGLSGIAGLQLRRGTGEGPGELACTADRCAANPRIQTLHRLPTDTAEPNLLVTTHAVDALHLQVSPAGWLIRTAQPLTATQINGARQAAVAAGMTIETKSQAPSLTQLRTYATAAGILLALAVLAMTVGLIRAEAARDLRTLTATGASARTRRAIAAATAGALGLTGAVVGTAAAYLATLALFRSEISQRLGDVPVLDLALVVVGLPAVAAAGAWLLAGREPPAIARQPIE
jgi:putative ABC transport system permease protein